MVVVRRRSALRPLFVVRVEIAVVRVAGSLHARGVFEVLLLVVPRERPGIIEVRATDDAIVLVRMLHVLLPSGSIGKRRTPCAERTCQRDGPLNSWASQTIPEGG